MLSSASSRLAYLDWLRMLAIIGVLFFHAAMPYVAEWEFHIKNKETSNLLLEFCYWLSRFRMPLLFFISGAVAYLILQRKTARAFIRLRTRRLIIPLLFGMLVVVPPQIYLERLTQGYTGNYWDFYKTVFAFRPYPMGGSLSWHHLWFILYLFIYDVAFTPVFKWFMSDRGKRAVQAVGTLARGYRMYWLMVPGIAIFASLVLHFKGGNDLIHDWCNFFYWLQFLLVGFLCIAVPGLMDSVERNRRVSLTIALLSLCVMNYFRWNQVEPWDVFADWRHDWRTYAFLCLTPIIAWSWLLSLVGYGKRYLNKRHRVQDYVNQAVYPFYILHQSVMMVFVYYIVQTSDTIGMKYLFTVWFTLAASMLIYHTLIRPYPVMRFLFGMKPAEKKRDGATRIMQEAADAPGLAVTGQTSDALLLTGERL